MAGMDGELGDCSRTDYTQVSIAPGEDETEINFAWYSLKNGEDDATPVVHFGTERGRA